MYIYLIITYYLLKYVIILKRLSFRKIKNIFFFIYKLINIFI